MERFNTDIAHNIPAPDGSGTELSTTKARQGVTGTGTRYVLWIGVAMVVIAFAIIYFSYARSW